MRRTLIGFIAALALGSVSPAAFAADMVPEPAPVASWTGFYLGAGGGVGWADFDIDHKRCILWDGVCSDSVDENWHDSHDEHSNGDIIGTVQGGFDFEIANAFVVGVYADWTFGDGISISRNHNDDWYDYHTRFDADVKDMVDVLGRAGFAPLPNLLVYGLVGWTWADVESDFKVRDGDGNVWAHNDDNFNANGLTFGGGVEWKFTDNLSVRGEYRFTDLDNFDNNRNWSDDYYDYRDRNDVNVNVQRVLFTLNWRFGGFGATTAAAY